MPIPVPYRTKGDTMQAITVIRSTADAIQTLAGTAPNAKTAREALPDHATATRACASTAPEVLKAADAIETAAHNMRSMAWNAKQGVMEELSDLALELYMLADGMEAEPATNRLAEIVQEVRAEQEKAAQAAIRIGALLSEARDEFEKSETAEFLAWGKENLGYSKPMVYRLMKLYKEYGDATDLHDMSPRAFRELAGISDEGKAKVVDLATQRAKAGEQAPTAAEVKAIKDETAPAKDPENDTTPVSKGDAEQASQQLEDSEAPWAPTAPASTAGPEAPAAPAQPSASEEVQRLYDIIEGLRDELAKAREATEAKGSKASKLPTLPQFRNDSYAARLGLSEAQAADPAKVKKALRDLVRAGYNSNHDAYPLLAEAAEALTEQAKAA